MTDTQIIEDAKAAGFTVATIFGGNYIEISSLGISCIVELTKFAGLIKARTIAEIESLRKQVIPDGYVLIRVEPTDEMNDAFHDTVIYEHDPIGGTALTNFDQCYKAMLETALKQSKPQGLKD